MSGHGAVDVAPLLQAAEWGGVPAVSFALLCLVVPVHEFLRAALGLAGPPPRLRAAAVTFGVGALLFGVGWIRVASVASEEESAERRWKVAIVQANIGSLEKRSAERGADGPARRTAAAYERGSRRAVEAGAELIVWPETAVTHRVPTGDPQLMNYNLRREGYGFLMELGRGRSFLLGLYEGARDASDPRTGASRDRRYNSAALRHPGAEDATWSIYRKVHLIPFGEFVPIALLEGVVRLPQSFEMLRGGADQPPLEDAGRRIVPFLCYEGILPDHVRDLAGDDRPDLLASLANDSWFGDTWEPHQHLNFTRIRAVEHRTPMVRATNTGISAFVSATGAVTARLGVGAEGILVADLPLVERGTTLFVRFGHLLPWVAWLWSLAAVVLALARSERLVE
jgi:apolipoprotein N-acyltransferase